MCSSHIDANNKKVFLFDYSILLGELRPDSAKSWELLFRDIIGRDEKIVIYSTTAHTETMQNTLAILDNPKLSGKIKVYSDERPPNSTDTAYSLPSFETIFKKCFSSTDSTLPAAENVTYISNKPHHIETATEKGHKTILVESLVDGMPKSFPSQIEEQIGNLFASHSGQQNEKKAVGDTKLTSSKALDAFAGEEEKKAAPTAEEKKVDDTNPTPSKTFDDYFTSKIFSDPLLDEKYVKFSQENYDKWQTDSDAHAALSLLPKPTESKDAPELCIEVTERLKKSTGI